MASISDLPTELLLTIFKMIYDNDNQTDNSGDDDIVEGGYSEHSSTWTGDDLHNPTMFPMAVAYVCRLWRDVLARSPEYWNKVVFEIGRDPAPLLDSLSWSNGQLLEVLVWNRIPDLTPAGKALENERVSVITQLLTPHFHRCSRISYEVAYASSLPSIATLFQLRPSILIQFAFECRVDDLQHDRLSNLNAVVISPNMPIVVPFSDLAVLSLGARLFIDLGRTYPSWLHNIRSKSYLTLTISQFRFQHGEDDDERYTLVELLSHLAVMKLPAALHLRNLSLAYEPEVPTSDVSFFIRATSLFLDNLGEDFLCEFFKRTRFLCANIRINRCTIPWVDRLALTSGQLHLDNLGYIHNIHNILRVWQGHHLWLSSCAAFDDELVDRLNDEEGNVYLHLLTVLTVKDCFNFTSAGLRKLMTIQKGMAAYDDDPEQMTLDSAYVEGGRLSLCEDDISWFRQQRGETDVSWTIIHPDGTYAYPLNHYHDTLGEY